MTKAGHIYLKIAKHVLKNNPNITPETTEHLIDSAVLEELEELLNLTPLIAQTIEFLNLSLGYRRKPTIPAEFICYILTGDPAYSLSPKTRNRLGQIKPEIQGDIAVEVVSRLQATSVQERHADFGQEYSLAYWYKFMTVELIGWDDAEAEYFYIVRIIMVAIGMDGVERHRFHSKKELNPEADYIREAYRRAQRRLKAEGNINSLQAFTRFLRNLKQHDYSLHPEIDRVLCRDEEVLARTAAQILQHNPPGTFCPRPKE